VKSDVAPASTLASTATIVSPVVLFTTNRWQPCGGGGKVRVESEEEAGENGSKK
jgi:hypothetical protein